MFLSENRLQFYKSNTIPNTFTNRMNINVKLQVLKTFKNPNIHEQKRTSLCHCDGLKKKKDHQREWHY